MLEVTVAPAESAIKLPANATALDSVTVLVQYPVDVWFDGRRTFEAALDFGGRAITQITIDPARRFPDDSLEDNVWPRQPR